MLPEIYNLPKNIERNAIVYHIRTRLNILLTLGIEAELFSLKTEQIFTVVSTKIMIGSNIIKIIRRPKIGFVL